MDRRAVFFVIAAAACALLILVTDDEFRWVPTATAIIYILLALASFFDARSRKHSS
jgi:uncharacterized membrane protein YqjE